jgi:alkylation response protein AidB-like acyl-CoA dehydrogenase
MSDVAEIAALANELAPATERERRLPDALLERLRASGLLLAGAPREAGGLELAPGETLRAAEEVARGDASAGWCVSIAATSSLLAAWLPEDARGDLFGAPDRVAAGVWAPTGKGRRDDGAVVVSGRWAYCSGITHAHTFFAGCVVEGGQRPAVVALRTADLDVLGTWHTLGLRGTGSHDSVADAVAVPAAHVLSLFDPPVLDRPLYRFPIFGFFALSIAAAALGNARGALDDFAALAVGKVGLGARRTLAERSPTQAAVAGAEAALRAADALFHDAIAAAWEAAQRPEPVSVALRTGLRLAATHAVRTAAEVVRTVFDLAGGSAIYDGAPLQRRFRDAHTATAHFQVNAASRELQGRILLGQDADAAML